MGRLAGSAFKALRHRDGSVFCNGGYPAMVEIFIIEMVANPGREGQVQLSYFCICPGQSWQ